MNYMPICCDRQFDMAEPIFRKSMVNMKILLIGR